MSEVYLDLPTICLFLLVTISVRDHRRLGNPCVMFILVREPDSLSNGLLRASGAHI